MVFIHDPFNQQYHKLLEACLRGGVAEVSHNTQLIRLPSHDSTITFDCEEEFPLIRSHEINFSRCVEKMLMCFKNHLKEFNHVLEALRNDSAEGCLYVSMLDQTGFEIPSNIMHFTIVDGHLNCASMVLDSELINFEDYPTVLALILHTLADNLKVEPGLITIQYSDVYVSTDNAEVATDMCASHRAWFEGATLVSVLEQALLEESDIIRNINRVDKAEPDFILTEHIESLENIKPEWYVLKNYEWM